MASSGVSGVVVLERYGPERELGYKALYDTMAQGTWTDLPVMRVARRRYDDMRDRIETLYRMPSDAAFRSTFYVRHMVLTKSSMLG